MTVRDYDTAYKVDPAQVAEWSRCRELGQFGCLKGVRTTNKFGRATAIPNSSSFVTLWPGTDVGASAPDVYVWPTVAEGARITHLSSSSAADVGQLVDVVGLDADWLHVKQRVALAGQTPVALDVPLVRCHRMGVCPGCAALAGIIYASDGVVSSGTPTDPSKVGAIINNGDNQTLMGIFSTAADHVGLLYEGYVYQSRGSAAVTNEIEFRARYGGLDGAFNLTATGSISSTGSSVLHHYYTSAPLVLPPKTDLYVAANASAVGSGVSVGFTVCEFKLLA